MAVTTIARLVVIIAIGRRLRRPQHAPRPTQLNEILSGRIIVQQQEQQHSEIVMRHELLELHQFTVAKLDMVDIWIGITTVLVANDAIAMAIPKFQLEEFAT